MSADIERLLRRVTALEDEIEKQNDFLGEVGDRLKRLEEPKPPTEKRGENPSDEERPDAVGPPFPTHEIGTPAALWVIESLKEEVVEGHDSAKKLANFARHLNGRAVYWQTIALKLLHSVATNEEIVEWLMKHPKQEKSDEDDIQTGPVVREGT